ncbi:hypothetical protein CAPTEDRAFT_169293 [Capitella teleta]|uniref:Sodium-dependent multivitamin transporter n=1 Tax=Capitella teleta TaxID=283909 RepID=R7TPJ2_CAPTE|nr:hypothetical protein CAPTEDRAFT_169293 [Capitella teleta]|eukprot:ELT92965.1 hypothetical protein CAPTEDRAFT_169293 [Capitella teleta]
MVSTNKSFSIADYVVFSLVLIISAGIGVFYGCTGGRQRTAREFLMADRQMSVLPVTLSMVASFMSAIMLLGTPAEMYIYGTEYMLIFLAYVLVAPVAAFLYTPVFYRLKLTSAYEYFEIRFKNKIVRIAGCCTYIIQMIMYMAIVLYAPSLALNAVTGFSVWGAVFSVGCVCTFYTTLGGMKAVMWTDVFQIIMMVCGLMAVLIQGLIDHGGFSNIIEKAREGGRLHFIDLDPDPSSRHTLWSLTIGALFMWLAINGTNQSQVQRAMTCPSLKKAQLSVVLNSPCLIVLLLLTSFCGLAMYAEFGQCDPLVTKRIHASDQLLPLYVMEALSHAPGVPGLFIACLFSGTLSTISSGLNSLAAVTIEDIIKSGWNPDLSEEKGARYSKVIAFGYGVIMMCLTVLASQMGAVLQAALALFGVIGGPILGIFSLGIFFPSANWKGCLAGLIVSFSIQAWVGLGATLVRPVYPKPFLSVAECFNSTIVYNATALLTNSTAVELTKDSSFLGRIYSLSYLWYTLMAVVNVIVVGLIVSYITGPMKPADVDPRTICNICDVICPCFPESLRRPFRHQSRKSQTVVPDDDDRGKTIALMDSGRAASKQNT